jgi:hypothetical protein
MNRHKGMTDGWGNELSEAYYLQFALRSLEANTKGFIRVKLTEAERDLIVTSLQKDEYPRNRINGNWWKYHDP